MILEKFFSAPESAWQVALKKAKVKLDLLTDIDMLLMVEKGIEIGVCSTNYLYAKANNKCIKDMAKIKNYHILIIGM